MNASAHLEGKTEHLAESVVKKGIKSAMGSTRASHA